MTKNLLERLLEERDWLLADGATGTNMFALGLPNGEAPDLWNLQEPDKVRQHYRSMIEAGTDIVLTNSFGGTRNRLKLHDAQDQAYEINKRAAELLNAQVRYRLSGVAKAQAGTRLAMVHLLDDAPQKALDALKASAAGNVPGDLALERERLRARALADLGRGDEALDALAGDPGPAALRLRADILWNLGEWGAAAAALRRLVPERPPPDDVLDEAEGRDVVHLAVALSMAGDAAGLVDLARRYKPAMAAGPYRGTFALLAGGLEPKAARSVAEELAAAERAQAFLADYRTRLQQAGLTAGN